MNRPRNGGGDDPDGDPSDPSDSDPDTSISGRSSVRSVSPGSSRGSQRRHNVERQNKRRQLQVASSDAIMEARRALDENTDMGLVKGAIKRCENATNLFYSMMGQGVEIHRLQLTDSQGNIEGFFNLRG